MSPEELEEALRVCLEWESAVERALDNQVRQNLDGLLSTRGIDGGFDDTAYPAARLMKMACLCSEGGAQTRAETYAYFARAREHQLAHIARLDAAIAAPATHRSLRIWDALGVGPAHTVAQQYQGVLALELLERVDESASLCNKQGVEAFGKAGRDASRPAYQRDCALDIFDRLMFEGSVAVAYRFALDVALGTNDPKLKATLNQDDINERMQNGVRLVRAFAAGYPGDPSHCLDRLGGLTDQAMERFQAPRTAGEEITGRMPSDVLRIETCESADQIFAAARAMSRTPNWYVTNGDSLRFGARIRVPATVEALRELRDEKGETSTCWDGMLISDRPASHSGEVRSMWVEAQMSAFIGEQDLDMIVEAHLGDTEELPPARLQDWIRIRARKLGVAGVADGLSLLRADERPPAMGNPSITPRVPHPARVGKKGPDALTDLIGEDLCLHESARWVASNGEVHIHDTARLECPTCYRSKVAAAPLHRLPEDHPARREVMKMDHSRHDDPEASARNNEERYLRRERFYAALRDDTRPIESVAQLTARDGFIDLDPIQYATGFDDEVPKGETRRRQVRSIRDAMMRR